MMPKEMRGESAGQFLSMLRLSNGAWRNAYRNPYESERSEWLFRGHACAAWSLVPTAFRESAWRDLLPYAGKLFEYKQSAIFEERKILYDFATELDSIGLPVPGGPLHRLRHLSSDTRDLPLGWPMDYLELAGLAQHHGLPTRWLDFTFDPLKAAHFAASEAPNTTDTLCVWAIHSSYLAAGRAGDWIGIGRPSRASNPNLHAQDGVLVSWMTSDSTVEPLDIFLGHQPEGISTFRHREDTSPIRKLLLDRRHAQALLTFLEEERVTASRLFPSADGAVKALKSRTRFEERAMRTTC